MRYGPPVQLRPLWRSGSDLFVLRPGQLLLPGMCPGGATGLSTLRREALPAQPPGPPGPCGAAASLPGPAGKSDASGFQPHPLRLHWSPSRVRRQRLANPREPLSLWVCAVFSAGGSLGPLSYGASCASAATGHPYSTRRYLWGQSPRRVGLAGGRHSHGAIALQVGGTVDLLAESCPLCLTRPNAPNRRDVLGTAVVAILSDHQPYAHISASRGDTNPASEALPLCGASHRTARQTIGPGRTPGRSPSAYRGHYQPPTPAACPRPPRHSGIWPSRVPLSALEAARDGVAPLLSGFNDVEICNRSCRQCPRLV